MDKFIDLLNCAPWKQAQHWQPKIPTPTQAAEEAAESAAAAKATSEDMTLPNKHRPMTVNRQEGVTVIARGQGISRSFTVYNTTPDKLIVLLRNCVQTHAKTR